VGVCWLAPILRRLEIQEYVMTSEPFSGDLHNGIAARLQDLVLETSDAEDFTRELAIFSASFFALPGFEVSCSVTVTRRNRPVILGHSSPQARSMEELQHECGAGPSATAIQTGMTVHVPDVTTERPRPEYIKAAAGHNVRSILGVPLPLEEDAAAVLTLYCPTPNGFTGEDITRAEMFAEDLAKVLRIRLRLTQLQNAREDLEAALRSRTAIDVATGVVMAQNRCSQETAIRILVKASGSRNLKLRDVAAAIIESVSDASVHTHFDE
jgi:GAF domain-containing protein